MPHHNRRPERRTRAYRAGAGGARRFGGGQQSTDTDELERRVAVLEQDRERSSEGR